MSERYELIQLFHAGALPGIPGGAHGPGSYVIDWETRIAHTADSIASYLRSIAQPDEETIAPVASPGEQETAQQEGAAIIALPQGTAFLVDQTLHTAQSPLDPLPEAQGAIVAVHDDSSTVQELTMMPGQTNAPDSDAHPTAVGGTEQTESPAPIQEGA